MASPIESPALRRQTGLYPKEWHGHVPLRIRMLVTIRSELPRTGSEVVPVAWKGTEYPAWVNSHGAVAAILPNGDTLGAKPGEFEVVEWHPPENVKAVRGGA